MNKRIGMIIERAFPPDIRVEKECRSLLDAGYDIYLLCPAKDKNEPLEDNYDGITVKRFHYKRSKLAGGFSFQFVLSLLDTQWINEISIFTRKFKIDVLHVHDFPLLKSTIYSIKKQKKHLPIVLDMHEFYSEMLRIWKNRIYENIFHVYKRILKQLIIANYLKYKNEERKLFPLCDGIIFVIDESRNEILKNHRLHKTKTTIIRNTEPTDFGRHHSIEKNLEQKYYNKYTISFIGNFSVQRGLQTLLSATSILKLKIPNLRVILVGNGSVLGELKSIVEKLELNYIVEFTGRVEFEKVKHYIEVSSVGVIPHIKSLHVDTTIPHKLFQYMIMQKPVIVSDARPLKRIVQTTKSGLVFRSCDHYSLAFKILQLNDKNLQRKLGMNGFKACMEDYNWENDAKKLIKFYREL